MQTRTFCLSVNFGQSLEEYLKHLWWESCSHGRVWDGGQQGSPSLNWGTSALTLCSYPNPLKYYQRKWTWAKSCLIHLLGVANTVFSIVNLLFAALQYKPKPYHKFLVSYHKSAFIGNSLFHALTHYKVFWQSKQPIRRIFWEGYGAKDMYYQRFSNVQSGRQNGPTSSVPSLWCILLWRLCLQNPPLLSRLRKSL